MYDGRLLRTIYHDCLTFLGDVDVDVGVWAMRRLPSSSLFLRVHSPIRSNTNPGLLSRGCIATLSHSVTMANPAVRLSLPFELVESILDELDGDAPSLAACARVCASWRSLFQGRLFHTVKLATNTACVQLQQALAISSHLVPLIRVLHLAKSPRLVDILLAVDSASAVPPVRLWNVHTLIIDTMPYDEQVLAALPGLRALRLTGCFKHIPDPWLMQSCRLETVTIVGGLDRMTGEAQGSVLESLLRRHIVDDVVSATLEWSFFTSRVAPVEFLSRTPALRELCLVISPFRTLEYGEKPSVTSSREIGGLNSRYSSLRRSGRPLFVDEAPHHLDTCAPHNPPRV
jgi:hypothetical protein